MTEGVNLRGFCTIPTEARIEKGEVCRSPTDTGSAKQTRAGRLPSSPLLWGPLPWVTRIDFYPPPVTVLFTRQHFSHTTLSVKFLSLPPVPQPVHSDLLVLIPGAQEHPEIFINVAREQTHRPTPTWCLNLKTKRKRMSGGFKVFTIYPRKIQSWKEREEIEISRYRTPFTKECFQH